MPTSYNGLPSTTIVILVLLIFLVLKLKVATHNTIMGPFFTISSVTNHICNIQVPQFWFTSSSSPNCPYPGWPPIRGCKFVWTTPKPNSPPGFFVIWRFFSASVFLSASRLTIQYSTILSSCRVEFHPEHHEAVFPPIPLLKQNSVVYLTLYIQGFKALFVYFRHLIQYFF